MKILHFSDPHLTPKLPQVPALDWMSKRITGALNYLLRRRRYFTAVRRKLAALNQFVDEQGVEVVLCTGDYSTLGTSHELTEARQRIQPMIDSTSLYLTVPGNHDLYVSDTVEENRFGKAFGDLFETDFPEYSVDGPWPQVKLIDEYSAVIAINSAIPHWEPWSAAGHVSAKQLGALADLLALPKIRKRFVFIMTHHVPLSGKEEAGGRTHRLVNANEYLSVCSTARAGALLFGHVHKCYSRGLPGKNLILYNAGSATMDGREGFWVFETTRSGVEAKEGFWKEDHYELVNSE